MVNCHSEENLSKKQNNLKRIILIGQPNVGKSLLFNKLSNSKLIVSNYPGTTVTFTSTKTIINNKKVELIDTPGIYSLNTITKDEEVAKKIILKADADVYINVIDAKNIDRMLHLTLDLIKLKLPLILVLNMSDESKKCGININSNKLEKLLGIPVIATIATNNQGIIELEKRIFKPNISKLKIKTKSKNILDVSISKQKIIDKILLSCVDYKKSKKDIFYEKISTYMTHPVSGIIILFFILYFALFKFVGEFGAGYLVDIIETQLFENIINPFVNNFLLEYVPWAVLRDLFGNQYGIFTFGLKYAIAIVFPIVTSFFLVFSIIEDSGYLPRLAMLIDSFFKKIGLNGRAVIPIVLGFGCDTMATLVTRTQETKKERILTTLLLALAIPCSAQLGVIFAILSGNVIALLIWFLIMILVFFLIGYLSSKVIKGKKPYFYMDIPPLRIPKISNVIIKTIARLEWYFKEILPIFILASVLIWFGKLTGIFDLFISILQPIVSMMGLPAKTAEIFLLGFFRRDYGAAGLYDIKHLLTVNQLLISSVVLTLFVPCVAQFIVMFKERGLKTALGILFFITPFSFMVGYLLNLVLMLFGVVL